MAYHIQKTKIQPRAHKNLKDTHFVNFPWSRKCASSDKVLIGSSFVIGRENCASFLTNLRMLLSQANAILDHCLVFLRFTWDLRGNSTFIFVSYTTDCPTLTSQEWSTKISDFEGVYLCHPMHLQIVHNTLTNFLRLDFKPAQGKISERPRKQVKSATSRLLHRLFILWVFVYLAENDVIMTSWKLARAQIRTQDLLFLSHPQKNLRFLCRKRGSKDAN